MSKDVPINDKSSSKIIELLKKMFEKMFKRGRNSVPQEEQEMVIEKLTEVKKKIDLEKEVALESGDFLKSYMLENQSIGIGEIIKTVQGVDFEKSTPLEMAKQAKKNIDKGIKDLALDDNVSEQFQDYHNHDPVALEKASKSANLFIAETTKEAGMGSYSNNLNSTARSLSDSAVDYMSQSPDSPAEQAGLVENNTNDHVSDQTNDNNNENEPDVSPELGMGA
jgi:hypothetical protein